MGDANQWELSKENIQPIKQGRKATVLSTAIDETQQRKLTLRKQEFEKEIRIYSGDDPLEIWYNYALWIEQNFPKGGKDGNLSKLLESCFSTIQSSGDVEKYKNDERHLDLWLKYINLCPYPLEVYQSLHTKKICCELATFYENWAWEMEKSGNTKKANAIYIEGLSKAKKIDSLEKSYLKFQARVAKDVMEGMQSTLSEDKENADAHRVVLSALKTNGPKAKAPTERVSGIIGTAGKIPVSKVEPKSNSSRPVFKIFQDGNPTLAGIAINENNTLTNESALPIKQSFAKENFKDPAKWTKNKTAQKSTNLVSLEDVKKHHKPSFVVHSDSDLNYPRSTPFKPEVNGILGIKKSEMEEWHVPLFIQEPFDPKFQPQYDKHKVYCGTEEFSFEEIHAARYLKEEAELKEREEKKRMKEEINSLKELMKQHQELISTLMNKHTTSSNPDPKRVYEDSWVALNKSVTNTGNESHMLVHDGFKMDKQLLDIQDPINLSSLHEIANARESGSNLKPNSFNCVSPTINTKIANNLINGFFNGSIFHKSASEDLKYSFECLSASNKENDKAPFEQKVETEAKTTYVSQSPFTIFTDADSVSSHGNSHNFEKKVPFQIYSDKCIFSKTENHGSKVFPCENQGLQNENYLANTKKTARAPLAIVTVFPIPKNDDIPMEGEDENDENLCPEGYHQVTETRHLAGILQPSINISFIPLEEQEKICREYDEKNEVEGIKPLDDNEPQEDFTMKVPPNPEAFAKLARFASTPRPWCQGIVPQITQNGEDYTMAFPIKSQNIDGVEEKFSNQSTKIVNGNEENNADKRKEKSGDLMPPPDNIEKLNSDHSVCTVSNDINMVSSTPATTTMKINLSPIMEASREYRSSSSSSSSSSCTTLGGLSHFHGISHLTQSAAATSRSVQYSRSRALTNESFGGIIHQNETSKSGYFADKSRGESINEAPNKKVCSVKCQRLVQKEEKEDLDNSFDPSKVAAMLLEMDPCLRDLNCKESSSSSEAPTTFYTGKYQENFEASVDLKKISYPSEIDPFCDELKEKLLSTLKEPVNNRGGFVFMNSKFPHVSPNIKLTLGKEMFHVKKMKGTGSYAQVFHSTTIDPLNVTILSPNIDNKNSEDEGEDESQMILKVQKPACYWEFYICHELRIRLKKMNYPINVIDSMIRVNRGYFYPNGSILVSQFHKYGTLLDFINKTKETTGFPVHEYVVVYLMMQLITMLKALHSSFIIHGDFKPDNIMITGLPELSFSNSDDMLNNSPFILKLIDFGRGIDMKMLPNGSTFVRKVATQGFTCCEMKENRPWTYQTDLYGLASVAHILLFGSYMNVKKDSNKWKLAGVSFQRRWNKELWHSFFDKLLNVSSCTEIPDLNILLEEFKAFYDKWIDTANCQLKNIIPILQRVK